MSVDVEAAVKVLDRMTVTRLRERYGEVFGEATRSFNKPHLVKRIAWRLQAIHEGGCPNGRDTGPTSWPMTRTCVSDRR